MTVHIPEPPPEPRPLSERLGFKVAETPADRLRRLSIAPDVPREELWKAIAGAVIDINERLAELEASVARRTRSEAAFDPRRRPTDATSEAPEGETLG